MTPKIKSHALSLFTLTFHFVCPLFTLLLSSLVYPPPSIVTHVVALPPPLLSFAKRRPAHFQTLLPCSSAAQSASTTVLLLYQVSSHSFPRATIMRFCRSICLHHCSAALSSVEHHALHSCFSVARFCVPLLLSLVFGKLLFLLSSMQHSCRESVIKNWLLLILLFVI